MNHARLALPLVILAALAVPSFGAAAACAVSPGPDVYAPQAVGGAELDIGYAYNYLAPYGTWLSLDPYGYVWCPRDMGYNWRPYTSGHWFWSDDGWCWDSDFDWGWMPFHYGRWGWDNDCGWFWTPGTVWGPAWVFWRYGGPYCGWAPIPPGAEFGAGIDLDAVAIGLPLNFWVFVDGPRFLARDLRPYCLPFERNAAIARLTEFRNRYSFRGGRMIDEGIDPETIRRVTGRRVTRYTLANAERPGSARFAGSEARVYRPAIRSNSEARPREFLRGAEARRELGAARVYEPRRTSRPRAPESARSNRQREPQAMTQRSEAERRAAESALRSRQAQEQAMLARSQAAERRAMAQRQAQETRRMRNPDERARTERQHLAQMAEQQKQHQVERQQMAERHKRETEQYRQSNRQGNRPSNPRRK